MKDKEQSIHQEEWALFTVVRKTQHVCGRLYDTSQLLSLFKKTNENKLQTVDCILHQSLLRDPRCVSTIEALKRQFSRDY
jgi:hypothetical protein